jgi:hypothetical protein
VKKKEEVKEVEKEREKEKEGQNTAQIKHKATTASYLFAQVHLFFGKPLSEFNQSWNECGSFTENIHQVIEHSQWP